MVRITGVKRFDNRWTNGASLYRRLVRVAVDK